MGRRKQIKVVCIKTYTEWVSAEHLIKSGIKPETTEGTIQFPKFEKGKIYNCSRVIGEDNKFVCIDTKILHEIGGKDSDYPKFLFNNFYMDKKSDPLRSFEEYFIYLKD